ncbi:hypothetical protein GALMADRAFT_137715 [Galerina marginata CBS 339.88]|uniref:Uncharacterized protein n=1 Tax=Galerina marginata (strain CBS 339.88) TaxID=685588 RepID=A0A067T8J8_GALM3|nr:hypothetical protein GALMADRAFT_137715 [Galerina marginata CBS 339.88]
MLPTVISDIFSRRLQTTATLHGHIGPVISIAFSPSGAFMASGGADGVKIWDLKTYKEINIPQQSYHERAQVSSVCWITRKNDSIAQTRQVRQLVTVPPTDERFQSRFEAVFSTRIARGGEILCVTADITGNDQTRIATCTRDKCVQVWLFNSANCQLVPVYSKAYKDNREIVPKSVAFDDNANRDLFVFGLYDGGLYKYSGKDATTLSKYQLGSQIGNAAVDLERRLCVIDNVGNGFDIYKVDTGSFVRTLSTGDPLKTHPKGVAFVDRSHAIVGGSDHGQVYVFDRKTGKVLRKLKHSRQGGAETIAVSLLTHIAVDRA